MIEGILAKEQEKLGLLPSHFRGAHFYPELKNQVAELVSFMAQSDIILAIRKAAQEIKINSIRAYRLFVQNLEHKEQAEKGMCLLRLRNGSPYVCRIEDFRKGFSHMLMDYEINLLSTAMVTLQNSYSNALILGHFHDGVTLYVPHTSSPTPCHAQDILFKANECLTLASLTYNVKPPLVFEQKHFPVLPLAP